MPRRAIARQAPRVRRGRRRLSVALAFGAVLAAAAPVSVFAVRPEPATVRVDAVLARLARAGTLVYCGGRRRREVALTFDDGPGPYTALALRILRSDDARATFCDVGRN